jgi:hypothetical protein
MSDKKNDSRREAGSQPKFAENRAGSALRVSVSQPRLARPISSLCLHPHVTPRVGFQGVNWSHDVLRREGIKRGDPG